MVGCRNEIRCHMADPGCKERSSMEIKQSSTSSLSFIHWENRNKLWGIKNTAADESQHSHSHTDAKDATLINKSRSLTFIVGTADGINNGIGESINIAYNWIKSELVTDEEERKWWSIVLRLHYLIRISFFFPVSALSTYSLVRCQKEGFFIKHANNWKQCRRAREMKI